MGRCASHPTGLGGWFTSSPRPAQWTASAASAAGVVHLPVLPLRLLLPLSAGSEQPHAAADRGVRGGASVRGPHALPPLLLDQGETLNCARAPAMSSSVSSVVAVVADSSDGSSSSGQKQQRRRQRQRRRCRVGEPAPPAATPRHRLLPEPRHPPLLPVQLPPLTPHLTRPVITTHPPPAASPPQPLTHPSCR